MRPILGSLLAALLLSSSTLTATAATLVNGSFEPGPAGFTGQFVVGGSTAIPGWTATDTGVEWYAPLPAGFGAAPSGQYVVDLANYVYSAGGIQQTIATVPGEVVSIGFFLGTLQGLGRDGTCEIVVSADGVTQTFTAVNHTGAFVYSLRTFTFVADDASATLSFRCLQNANVHFANIDGVAVQTVTAASGTTWARVKSLYR
ncbi:MAG: DUF642 domain-containing protein [Candidatus Eisenbacteria bacterium]